MAEGIKGVAGDAAGAGRETARKVKRNPAYQVLVKVGLVTYGVVHLLIAWLGIRLAMGQGTGSETASNAGALRALSDTPLGVGLLWVAAIGFATLVVWQVVSLFVGFTEFEGLKRWGKRVGALFRAILYAYLGITAANIALGSDTSAGEGQAQESVSGGLMALPFGQVLVALVGAVIIGFGVGRIVKAFTKSFNDDLETTLTGAGEKFAQAGYAAKGVALAGVGGLFIWAALTHDSSRAGGLDQAIQTFLGLPFGPWLVSALALGIGQFGLYCFYWAMHAKHA